MRSHASASADDRTFAAVDLGSNSFHLIVARREHGELQVLDRLREMVRLAAGLDARRRLSAEAQDRALACLARFGQRLSTIPPDQIRAVATNTLRKAKNPRAFLRQAETVLGHPIEIIGGYEEARLIYRGVTQGLASDVQRRLVIDIGGGSTEFVIGRGQTADALESLSLGCVAMSNRFFANGKITRPRLKKAHTTAALEMRPVREAFRRIGWDEVVGSSGTVRAIGRALEDAGWNTGTITPAGMKKLRVAMEELGHCNKLGALGVSAERAPVFPGGVAILDACFRNLAIDEMRVSDSGLREGVLHDLVGRMQNDDPREAAVEGMVERYRVDRGQAGRVERTALEGFDQVDEAWDLGPSMRRLLGWAARLHEVGLSVAHEHHNQHGAYLVEHSSMTGFSTEEQQVVATLILGHRRKLIAPVVFGDLPDRLVTPVKRACVVLRIAALLHRSRWPTGEPSPTWEAQSDRLRLTLRRGWLAEHPLTEADLGEERRQLKRVKITLEYR
ncbi:MAG: exopolyphosphatase [Gemmatimonadetes bacterium]|nr:exopolyphosphatase [Gemmatimonadota bacterium]